MSMVINVEKGELVFIIPNSEASLEAQHHGIADRTVGSYYMSDNQWGCYEFLNKLKGHFFLDLGNSIALAERYLNELRNRGLANSFKQQLRPQFESISVLKWFVENENSNYYRISPPTVNEQKKYLKLDNENQVFKSFKSLLLGDLTKLVFKKIGADGFLVYFELADDFDKKLENGTVRKWAQLF